MIEGIGVQLEMRQKNEVFLKRICSLCKKTINNKQTPNKKCKQLEFKLHRGVGEVACD